MSDKTVEKRRNRSWLLYLMLRKCRYKAWIISNEALFRLSFTTVKMKIQYISSKKQCKDAAVLKNASWPSGVMKRLTAHIRIPWQWNRGLSFSDFAARSGQNPTSVRRIRNQFVWEGHSEYHAGCQQPSTTKVQEDRHVARSALQDPRATINLLKDTFGDCLISRFGPVNWPPRSCDLTPLDYFLWGYVKSLVYADKPQTLDHLEDNIRRVIADIRPQMLEKVIENWTSSLDYIRASRGSHMPEIIFKM
ncbi:uncharacterized protein TNCV_2474331 [Trichonephila clavipes]|nr:uncharacterized protein TNCV_2474331 [Trichonephila clavipes]